MEVEVLRTMGYRTVTNNNPLDARATPTHILDDVEVRFNGEDQPALRMAH